MTFLFAHLDTIHVVLGVILFVIGVILFIIGVIIAILGKTLRRPNYPTRAVRFNGVAVALWGTSAVIGSLPNLLGLHTGALRMVLQLVTGVPLVLALMFSIATVVIGNRAPGAGAAVQSNPRGGQQPQQMR